jgi:arylsulfatase A-like enzyme
MKQNQESTRTIRWMLLFVSLTIWACGAIAAETTAADALKTKNVVVVVADGERYTETWGDPKHANIPKTAKLAKEGVVFTAFTNNGQTLTVPAHMAIATGRYENNMDNKGESLPSEPSFLQVWLNQAKTNSSAAWIICSKAKLNVLGDTTQAEWKGLGTPSVDCADRDDDKTFQVILAKLKKDHPRMVMINLSAPDKAGHTGDFNAYLKAIRDTDGNVANLWQYLQKDPFYANQTAFFLLNDHGRHTGDKFEGHGCDCEGCRHIMLMALGPDFKKGAVVSKAAEQIDVPTTIADMMGFALPVSGGRLLNELFVHAPASKPVKTTTQAPAPAAVAR